MNIKRKLIQVLSFLFFISIATTCTISIHPGFRQMYNNYNSFIHSDTVNAEYLKVHYKNGYVSVFDNWKINRSEDSLIGTGRLFDINRNILNKGNISVNLDDIAIIETNQLDQIQDRYNKRDR